MIDRSFVVCGDNLIVGSSLSAGRVVVYPEGGCGGMATMSETILPLDGPRSTHTGPHEHNAITQRHHVFLNVSFNY